MNDRSTESDPLVPVTRARNPAEAQVLFAVLNGSGIPARISGTSLTDEFALSQSQLAGVDILVPGSLLDEARAVLAAAREPLEPEEEEEEETAEE
jgi:hypothetical protein